MALGRYPYNVQKGGFWSILSAIQDQPVPIPTDCFPFSFASFIACACEKDPVSRYTAAQLLAHPFITSDHTIKIEKQKQKEEEKGEGGTCIPQYFRNKNYHSSGICSKYNNKNDFGSSSSNNNNNCGSFSAASKCAVSTSSSSISAPATTTISASPSSPTSSSVFDLDLDLTPPRNRGPVVFPYPYSNTSTSSAQPSDTPRSNSTSTSPGPPTQQAEPSRRHSTSSSTSPCPSSSSSSIASTPRQLSMIERRERFGSESRNSDASLNKYERKSVSPVRLGNGKINSNCNNNSNKISSRSKDGSQSSLNRFNDIRRSPSISRMRNNSTDSEIENREVQKYLRKTSENTETSEIPCIDSKLLSPIPPDNTGYSLSQKSVIAQSRERGKEGGRGSRDPLTAENHFQFNRDNLTVEGISVKLNTLNKTGESSKSIFNYSHSSRDNKSCMQNFDGIHHDINTSSDSENDSSHEWKNSNKCHTGNENESSEGRSESQTGVREVTASSANKIAAAWCDYITYIATSDTSFLEDGNQTLRRRDCGQNDDGVGEEVDDEMEYDYTDRGRIKARPDEKARKGGRIDNKNDMDAKSTVELTISYTDISKLAKEMIVVPKDRIISALELNCSDYRRINAPQSQNNNSNTRIHDSRSDDKTVSEVIARIGSMDEVENNTTLLRNAFLEVMRSMKDGVARTSVERTAGPVKFCKVNPFDLISDVIDSNFESLNNSIECSAVNSTHTTRRPSLSETGMLQHHGMIDYHGKVAESKCPDLVSRKFNYDESAKSECNEMSGEYEEEFDLEVENEKIIEGTNNYLNLNSRKIYAMQNKSQNYGKESKNEKDEKETYVENDIEREDESEDEYNSDFEDEKST